MAVIPITDSQFNQLLADNPNVIVKYFADWCGTCKLISPKFRRLSDDSRFENIRFVEVNAEENETARKAAGVDNLPFFATFKNGQLLTGSATSKEDKMLQLLEGLK